MKKCVKCDFELEDDYRYCTQCGEKQPQVKQCPHCGKFIPKDCTFCTECGKSVSERKKLNKWHVGLIVVICFCIIGGFIGYYYYSEMHPTEFCAVDSDYCNSNDTDYYNNEDTGDGVYEESDSDEIQVEYSESDPDFNIDNIKETHSDDYGWSGKYEGNVEGKTIHLELRCTGNGYYEGLYSCFNHWYRVHAEIDGEDNLYVYEDKGQYYFHSMVSPGYYPVEKELQNYKIIREGSSYSTYRDCEEEIGSGCLRELSKIE